MATGTQYKKGFFEILNEELRKQGMSIRTAHDTTIAIIDKVIPNDTREDKQKFKTLLLQTGISLISSALKL